MLYPKAKIFEDDNLRVDIELDGEKSMARLLFVRKEHGRYGEVQAVLVDDFSKAEQLYKVIEHEVIDYHSLPKEIERSFRLKQAPDFENTSSKSDKAPIEMRQGYMVASKENTVRIRVEGDEAELCIKMPLEGKDDAPGKNMEFEFPVPKELAESYLDGFDWPQTEKKRHFLNGVDGKEWSIDVYKGALQGLVKAEIEFKPGEKTDFQKPLWLADAVEVTASVEHKDGYMAEHGMPTYHSKEMGVR